MWRHLVQSQKPSFMTLTNLQYCTIICALLAYFHIREGQPSGLVHFIALLRESLSAWHLLTAHIGFTHVVTHVCVVIVVIASQLARGSYLSSWSQQPLSSFISGLIFSLGLFASDTLFETSGVPGGNKGFGFDFHKWKQKPLNTHSNIKPVREINRTALYLTTEAYPLIFSFKTMSQASSLKINE